MDEYNKLTHQSILVIQEFFSAKLIDSEYLFSKRNESSENLYIDDKIELSVKIDSNQNEYIILVPLIQINSKSKSLKRFATIRYGVNYGNSQVKIECSPYIWEKVRKCKNFLPIFKGFDKLCKSSVFYDAIDNLKQSARTTGIDLILES